MQKCIKHQANYAEKLVTCEHQKYGPMRLIIGFIALLFITSCIDLASERGNGVRIEEKITIDEFDRLEIGGAFIVKLTQDESDEVIVETDENLLDFIEIAVRGNTLEVNSERRLDSREGIIISIPIQELTRLSSSGASEVMTTNPIQTENLDIDLSGAGKLDLKLDAQDISLDISGASLIYLEGAAQTLDINMSGASSLEASELEVKDCFAQISGVGKILVNVTGTLDAEVSGLGEVVYVGEPESVKGDVSGVGNIGRK